MNTLIDKLFERGVAIVAFVIGSFHLLNVSGLIVLSTRDIRIFHLMMMLVLSSLSMLAIKNGVFSRIGVPSGFASPAAPTQR